MIDFDKIAGMVASVVASTRYADEIWTALEHQEKEMLIRTWANFIRADPDTAADQILASLLSHPLMGEAWRKLSDVDGLPLQRPAIVYLVSLGNT